MEEIEQLEREAKKYSDSMGDYNENPKQYNHYRKLWSNTIDLISIKRAAFKKQ